MNWYKKAQLTDDWDDYENPGEFPILIDQSDGTPPSPEIITSIIKKLVEEFGCSPYEINSGECDSFGETLVERIPGAKLYETNIHSSHPSHLFMYVGGLFYDAEHPQGVSDWKQLSIYKQKL